MQEVSVDERQVKFLSRVLLVSHSISEHTKIRKLPLSSLIKCNCCSLGGLKSFFLVSDRQFQASFQEQVVFVVGIRMPPSRSSVSSPEASRDALITY